MENKKNEIEEVYLAADTGKLEEAAQIAETTAEHEKFVFYLHYDVVQKELLMSLLETSGAVITGENEDERVISALLNMEQLALVKSSGCIERVGSDEGANPYLSENAGNSDPDVDDRQEDAEAGDVVEENNASGTPAELSEELSAAEVTTAVCPCPGNQNMENAKRISDESNTGGCICCPGSEQWFVFTAARTGRYTILTTGSSDTVGTLYDCCGNQLAEVDDYAPCGKINFRIVCNLTAGATYYVKVRLYGSNTGSYVLRVTEQVFADYVTVSKDSVTLDYGVTYELPITPNYTYRGYNGAKRISGLSVSVSPSYADEKKVWWYAQDSDILSTSTGWDNAGNRYIHITAKKNGTTKLFAEDWNENGKRDECSVNVKGKPVTGVTLDRSSIIVSLNDTERLNATVTPSDATDKSVVWTSSNWNVVDVDSDGVITGRMVGTATVSARTADGGFTASCTVTVDRREKVVVKKDSHSFYVKFADGKVWKNIGIDLSKREDNYGAMEQPPMWPDNYESLIAEEQRYLDNIYKDRNTMELRSYSEKQLGFLYLLDPLGIEYYMRNHACHDMSMTDTLFFKDDVYKEIFGEQQASRFYFTINDNGDVQYGAYPYQNRNDVYSNAEVLFGFHVIFDWERFARSILTSIFESIPGVSDIQTGVEIYQAMFHTGSFWGLYSSYAKSAVEEYVKQPLNDFVADKLGEKAHKCIRWVANLLVMLKNATLDAIIIPNINDMTIYNAIKEDNNYRIVFDNSDEELSIQEIISRCES